MYVSEERMCESAGLFYYFSIEFDFAYDSGIKSGYFAQPIVEDSFFYNRLRNISRFNTKILRKDQNYSVDSPSLQRRMIRSLEFFFRSILVCLCRPRMQTTRRQDFGRVQNPTERGIQLSQKFSSNNNQFLSGIEFQRVPVSRPIWLFYRRVLLCIQST